MNRKFYLIFKENGCNCSGCNVDKISKTLGYDKRGYEFEENTVYVGKKVSGMKPLFYKSVFFNNLCDLETFYRDNTSRVVLVDNNGIEVEFNEFKNTMTSFDGDGSYLNFGVNYYLDKDGNEFLDIDSLSNVYLESEVANY